MFGYFSQRHFQFQAIRFKIWRDIVHLKILFPNMKSYYQCKEWGQVLEASLKSKLARSTMALSDILPALNVLLVQLRYSRNWPPEGCVLGLLSASFAK